MPAQSTDLVGNGSWIGKSGLTSNNKNNHERTGPGIGDSEKMLRGWQFQKKECILKQL